MPTIDPLSATTATLKADLVSVTTTAASSKTNKPAASTELVTETGAVITDNSGNPILIES